MDAIGAHGDSAASVVRAKVLRSRKRFWRADDFADASRTAVLREMSRLASNGELKHIRKGLYWRGEKTLLGMSGPPAAALVQAVAGTDGVGPAGASAALALGLSTQHPRREMVAVPGRLPQLKDRRIELKSREGRQDRLRYHLNWWEVATLEVLADWSRFVELEAAEAVARLREWFDSGKVRVEKLVKASKDEDAVVREGLRNLLTQVGLADQASVVSPAHSLGRRTPALAAA